MEDSDPAGESKAPIAVFFDEAKKKKVVVHRRQCPAPGHWKTQALVQVLPPLNGQS